MRRTGVCILLIVFCLSCEVNRQGAYTPAGPADTHTITNMHDLFIIGTIADTVCFKTNDTAYYSNKGFSLWCLLEGEQPVFESRQAAITKVTGNMSAGYGLVCCFNDDPEYGSTMLVVMCNTVREYIVGEVTNNLFTEIIPWKESVFLKSGYNQVNTVGVEYNNINKVYTLYFNGQPETTFTDDEAPFHTGGRQGYIVIISPLDDFPAIPVEVQFKEL